MNERVLSLDVFRGMVIVLMIVVNYQLSTAAYPMLLHAPWNDCSVADLVFPGFLFIVGMTCVVALKQHQIEDKKKIIYSIMSRSGILILLGLFLNAYPFFIWSQLRYYGILQRIAVCYFFCVLIYLNTTVKTQIALFILIIGSYWIVLTQIPVPGVGANQLTTVGSWVSYIEQLLFSPDHLFGKTYDPEGFLSTIPALATTLSGLVAGQLVFNTQYSRPKKWLFMFGAALLCLLFGWLWHYDFPLNKSLWTSSFVLWTSGWSLLLFSFCYLLIDILGYTRWSTAFKLFGVNALFAFIVHVLLIKMQLYYKIETKQGIYSVKGYILSFFFKYWSGSNAVLIYSLVFLLINFGLVYWLYKKKIFIKI
ncbi:MAG: DUF5009 domain-containing protein [Legionella sp.]|nr:MAG: DUF5009 domain-containing protein [Legionella sp.]